jgi:hypothetical protein
MRTRRISVYSARRRSSLLVVEYHGAASRHLPLMAVTQHSHDIPRHCSIPLFSGRALSATVLGDRLDPIVLAQNTVTRGVANPNGDFSGSAVRGTAGVTTS